MDLPKPLPAAAGAKDPHPPRRSLGLSGRALLRRDLAKLLVPVLVVPVAVAGVIFGPVPVFLAVGLILFMLWLLASPGRPRRVFLVGLAGLLIGYAFLGRGLAHAGAPPVYVGEMVLGLGVLALIFGRPAFRLDLIRLLVLGFMAWGLVRTVPYLGTYGQDALRDAVTWGYGFFAIAVAALVTGPDLLRGVDQYRRLIVPLCLFILATLPIGTASLPAFPGSEVPFIGTKAGDFAVHLAGVAAFVLLGLYAAVPTRIPEALVWLAWLPVAIVMGVINRGGMGAIAMSGLAVVFGRAPARFMTPLFIGVIGLVTVVYIDPVIDLGGQRTVSAGQVIENVTSVFSQTEDPALEGTKAYRLRWWGTIVNYTIGGQYFWTGKGFGVNLADDDGFQLFADHSLRAPHNGHFEILARTGVPGLVLWVALNGAWAASVIGAARRARALGSRIWPAILIWLLVYWAAMMVNASFDPYLQGPQGGIWYWAVLGAGLVAMDVVRGLPNLQNLPNTRVRPRAPSTQSAGA